MNAMVPYRDFASAHCPATRPAPVCGGRKRGILQRLFDAVAQAQQRQADREIVRFLGGRLGEDGLRLTDQLERQLADHFAPKGGFQP